LAERSVNLPRVTSSQGQLSQCYKRRLGAPCSELLDHDATLGTVKQFIRCTKLQQHRFVSAPPFVALPLQFEERDRIDDQRRPLFPVLQTLCVPYLEASEVL